MLTDDQRWDTIGRCLNGFDGLNLAAGADACMPHLQTDLIANGHTFLRGYATTAVCCPSRASALTGLYSRHTGVTKNSSYPSFNESSTIATWLDAAGYRTGFIGKYLNGYGQKNRDGTMPEPHVPPGWDTWHAFWSSSGYNNYSLAESVAGSPVVVNTYSGGASTNGDACAPGNFYQTDLICRRALDFVAADPLSPLLLYLWPSSPHLPATPPTRWAGSFSSVLNPRYPNYDQVPSPNPPKWLKTEPLTDREHSQFTTQFRQQLDTNRAVDDAIHALYQQLSADGRLANTVFVFSSDNSMARGEHRHDKKACEYEECHRVPFVVACPTAVCASAQPGTVDTEHFALNIDIPVTFAELAGVTPPFTVDGDSLVPLLAGTGSGRTWFTIDDDEPYVGKVSGIVSKEPDGHIYKYVVIGGQQYELYDLTEDRWELTNLAGDGVHSDVQAHLAERLAQALVRGPGAAMLTAGVTGEGTVASSPSGVSCPSDCWEVFGYGTQVTLTPTPATGWVFAGWGGACSGTGPCELTMTDDMQIAATFEQAPTTAFTLHVLRQGAGTGTVTSDPPGIDCGADCAEAYAPGTQVTLTAQAAEDSTFGGWSGACSGTALTCAVTMDAAKSVTATFASGSGPPPTGSHTLTVTRDGTGRGKVSSSPAGIDCGADCAEAYAPGTQVTLTAQAAKDSTFSGWSGACSGTALTCAVTMDGSKSVTATFALA